MRIDDEDELLRSVAIQNAQSILAARRRAEEEILQAKAELERRTGELARSLAVLRATLESTWDGILAVDQHGTVAEFNELFVTMWRIPPAIIDTRDSRRVFAFLSQQLREPGRFPGIATAAASFLDRVDVVELQDGRIFECYSSAPTVDDERVGLVWSFRDVTERRRAERVLKEETHALELLNRAGTALASTLDLQSLLQAVTDAATELSGARFGAFFYNTVGADGEAFMLYTLSGAPREAFERFGQPRATPLFGPTFRGEGPIRLADVRQDPRYGQMTPHRGMPPGHLPVRSYLAVPVVSRSGEVIGGLFFGHPQVGVFDERSEHLVVGVAAQAAVAIDNARLFEAVQRAAEERKQLLESERAARSEAERASAMKDAFLATLSHELRTPLNSILGWTQILRARGVGDAGLAQGLEVMERNARMQTQLIEDLLDMSRITSGKMRLDVQPVTPATFVTAAIQTVRPAADAKGIKLSALLDPTAGPITGDPNRLQQVVWNLLSNAIKFTGRNGRVQVALARVESHVEITVADTGVGIRPEFVPLVFERFRQADSSHTRQAAGLGLGLAIVKQLVELHGGEVLASSPGEGRGATFTVRLPVTAVHAASGDLARGHPPELRAALADFRRADLSGITVLVVDDQADARDLIGRVLAECGAEVLAASTADEALRLVEEKRPHALVSDIGMPEVDGYELIRRVRALRTNGPRIPAIALTAFARSEDRTRALRAGFAAHVSKPVEPSELVATVASVVGRADEAG